MFVLFWLGVKYYPAGFVEKVYNNSYKGFDCNGWSDQLLILQRICNGNLLIFYR